MTFLSQFWRGQFPLVKTFWLGWAVPVIGGHILISTSAWWLISNVGLVVFYVSVAVVVTYSILALVPVWRSTTVFTGSKALKYGARTAAALATTVQVAVVGAVIVAVISAKMGIDPTSDSDRLAEKTAIPSATHPLAGFWKYDSADSFGLAISPAEGNNIYSVSFCGPGGCFKPGTYRPNTPIIGDNDYQVVSNDTLRVHGADGWSTITRSTGRGGEDCTKP